MAEISRCFEVVLKDKQVEAIETFVNGSDVFVVLPTGYCKLTCIQQLHNVK